MTAQTTASDALTARIAATTDAQLVDMLQRVDHMVSAGFLYPHERQHHVLVRSRMISEVERRWPAADAAVAAAFDAAEAAAVAGDDVPDVDYVAVLLAAVPAP